MEEKTVNKIALDYRTTDEEEKSYLDILNHFVVGQDFAKKKIVTKYANALNRLTRENRPAGIFLFVGPMGTGKDYLIETFARLVFNDPNAIVRVNCLLFSESMICQEMIDMYGVRQQIEIEISKKEDEISKENKKISEDIKIIKNCLKLVKPEDEVEKNTLYQKLKDLEEKKKGNKLDVKKIVEKIKRSPMAYPSIIVFEGIDEAHPGVVKIIRQILKQGGFISSDGRYHSFSNSFIFLKCGLLTEDLGRRPITLPSNSIDKEGFYEKAITPIKKLLSPELIKEVGKENVIVFLPFSANEFRQIIKLKLSRLTKISFGKPESCISVIFTKKLHDFIYEETGKDSFNKDIGASSINRVIEMRISEPIFKLIKKGQNGGIIPGDIIEIDVVEKDKKKEIVISKIQNT